MVLPYTSFFMHFWGNIMLLPLCTRIMSSNCHDVIFDLRACIWHVSHPLKGGSISCRKQLKDHWLDQFEGHFVEFCFITCFRTSQTGVYSFILFAINSIEIFRYRDQFVILIKILQYKYLIKKSNLIVFWTPKTIEKNQFTHRLDEMKGNWFN